METWITSFRVEKELEKLDRIKPTGERPTQVRERRAEDLLVIVGSFLASLVDCTMHIFIVVDVLPLTVSRDTTALTWSEALLEERREVGIALVRRAVNSKLRGALAVSFCEREAIRASSSRAGRGCRGGRNSDRRRAIGIGRLHGNEARFSPGID